jgi:hypothetical protein
MEQAEGPVPEPPLCEEIDLLEYMLEQRAYKARILKEGAPFFTSSKFDEDLKAIIRAAWEEDHQSPGGKD